MTSKIKSSELINAYREVVAKYPNIPPMAFWRPWEIAYIRKHISFEPGFTLDLACGDGKFADVLLKPFDLHLIGCDFNPNVVSEASKTGIYKDVIVGDARQLPFETDYFSNIFSNCAFEHFDDIDIVLKEIFRVLRPGGKLIFTAVTDKFIKWQPFIKIGMLFGFLEHIKEIQKKHIELHNLVNIYSADGWANLLRKNNFNIEYAEEYISWLPTYVFLVFDQLWHYNHGEMSLGEKYYINHADDRKLPLYFDILFHLLSFLTGKAKRGSGVIVVARKEDH